MAPLAAALLAFPIADVADGAAAKRYANCTALNKDYPHGVGRKGAWDRVSGSTRPVTNFKRSDKLYNLNTGRDGDRDGVACEKL